MIKINNLILNTIKYYLIFKFYLKLSKNKNKNTLP